MPVNFLSNAQRESYGRYTMVPSPHDLTKYFHLGGGITSAVLPVELRRSIVPLLKTVHRVYKTAAGSETGSEARYFMLITPFHILPSIYKWQQVERITIMEHFFDVRMNFIDK